ncbi:hypothetical protein MY04_3349 [Flammeovirga sp. MY04]|uniref:hypothetical protein n=1 Tax=Flammeovirga sp. MY04 TaxID=1191459 RepID=UPI00080641FB|nr:hypothetical protein [Flammeovirga sp. MY04]ANQ50711.1 hypothetical protein MY04_3349 [Flammeovirga sp. MY04]
MLNYKNIFLFYIFIAASIFGCSNKVINQKGGSMDIVKENATSLFENDNLEIIPNEDSSFFLCYPKQKTQTNPTSYKFVVLDKEGKIIKDKISIFNGKVQWLDKNTIETIEKMGIDQNGTNIKKQTYTLK